MKFLVVLAAVLLLLWLLFGRKRVSHKTADRDARPRRSDALAAEGMVACAHCGVNVPVSEALHRNGLAYCSVAHRDAGPPPGHSAGER
jgi:uncharacterized protein